MIPSDVDDGGFCQETNLSGGRTRMLRDPMCTVPSSFYPVHRQGLSGVGDRPTWASRGSAGRREDREEPSDAKAQLGIARSSVYHDVADASGGRGEDGIGEKASAE